MLEEALLFNSQHLQKVDTKGFGVESDGLYIYRDEKNHETLSGNKIRKLYGSIHLILKNNVKNIVTIGGNYSNYLHACSFLPELLDIHLILIVKGHRPKSFGYTLRELEKKNIELHFISHEELKANQDSIIKTFLAQNTSSVFIPEGGNIANADEGFIPLISNHFNQFDKICVGVGTGATYRSILQHKSLHTNVHGYSAVKDNSLFGKICFDYTFGGFGKMTDELFDFVIQFYETNHILLDPVYTSKMMYGILSDFKKGIHQPDENIVAIHTGGLQGWHGIVERNPKYKIILNYLKPN